MPDLQEASSDGSPDGPNDAQDGQGDIQQDGPLQTEIPDEATGIPNDFGDMAGNEGIGTRFFRWFEESGDDNNPTNLLPNDSGEPSRWVMQSQAKGAMSTTETSSKFITGPGLGVNPAT